MHALEGHTSHTSTRSRHIAYTLCNLSCLSWFELGCSSDFRGVCLSWALVATHNAKDTTVLRLFSHKKRHVNSTLESRLSSDLHMTLT